MPTMDVERVWLKIIDCRTYNYRPSDKYLLWLKITNKHPFPHAKQRQKTTELDITRKWCKPDEIETVKKIISSTGKAILYIRDENDLFRYLAFYKINYFSKTNVEIEEHNYSDRFLGSPEYTCWRKQRKDGYLPVEAPVWNSVYQAYQHFKKRDGRPVREDYIPKLEKSSGVKQLTEWTDIFGDLGEE